MSTPPYVPFTLNQTSLIQIIFNELFSASLAHDIFQETLSEEKDLLL